MYVQSTTIRVPLGHMEQMRTIIARQYLPKIRTRSGFVSAMLMEQLDDPDRAELLILWDNQDAVESFNSTGELEATIHGLAVYLPGVQVQRQGYALTVTTTSSHMDDLEETHPFAAQTS
ncbi:MAG: antibiotic biosynthesis monooxygenase [Chloroflexota bacterium]